MSLLDFFKADALAALHATANALHAGLASQLRSAGHDVSADDHIDKLVKTAIDAGAATGQPQGAGIAPNYADHALASFNLTLTRAMLQFAQAHLPAQYQPVIAPVTQVAAAVVEGDKTDIVDTVTHVVETVAEVAIPGAAPIVELAAPIIEKIEHAFEGGGTQAAEAAAVDSVAAAVLPVAEKAADAVLPVVGGELAAEAVQGVESAVEGALGVPAAADHIAPEANHSGV